MTQPLALIIIDDLGQDLLFSTATPFLDSWVVSAQKNYTDKFVASPNCSCTRGMVESGFYAIRDRNLVGSTFNDTSTYSLPIGPWLLAKRAGLASQVGKWHLCAFSNLSHRTNAGYQQWGGSQANLGQVGNYFEWEAVINEIPTLVQEYATDWVTARAVDEIQEGIPFISVSYNAVHKPIHTPPGYGEASVEVMLQYLDESLATLIPLALQQGYAIILFSDNGGTKDEGDKGNLYHSTVATPFICDGFNRSLFDRQIIDNTDIHATIVDCVTGVAPDDCDGISLLSGIREVGFSDKFKGVGEFPGSDWLEMASDGQLKVIRRCSSGALVVTNWYDEPTSQDVTHLIQALDVRTS